MQGSDKSTYIHDIENVYRKDGYFSHSVSDDYTFTDVDKIRTLLVATSTSAITAALPTVADNLNRYIRVMKVDATSAGTCVIDGEGAETIKTNYGSFTTITIHAQWGYVDMYSDGTQWVVVGMNQIDKWHVVGDAGEPAFTNSWVYWGAPYTVPSFRQLANGDIDVRGLIKTGVVGSSAFLLPAGKRPPNTYIFSCVSNAVFGRVDVFASGLIKPTSPSNNTFVSLDGIRYSIL